MDKFQYNTWHNEDPNEIKNLLYYCKKTVATQKEVDEFKKSKNKEKEEKKKSEKNRN